MKVLYPPKVILGDAQKMRNPILVQSHNLQKVSESNCVNFFSISKNVGID